MMRHVTGLLVAVALLGSGAAPAEARAAGNELDQMAGLVRFLEDRLAQEDPTLEGDVLNTALLDALEMMGVEVPSNVRGRPPLSAEQLATAILTAPPPGSARAQPSTAMDDPFGEESGGTTEAEVTPETFPSAPPDDWKPDPERMASIRRILNAFPIPGEYRRDQTVEMEPVALMARTLIENPHGRNPWEPEPKPVGDQASEQVRRDLRSRLDSEPPSKPEGTLFERLQRIRERVSRGPEVTTAPSLSTPRTERGADLKSRLEAMMRRREVRAMEATDAEVTTPDAPSPFPPHGQPVPPGFGSAPGFGAAPGFGPAPRSGGALAPAPDAGDLARVVIPDGGLVEVAGGGGTAPLHTGSHSVGWNSEIHVVKGRRVLLVYPREGAIFRLGSRSRSRVEAGGVRQMHGEVVKFLARPGDSLTVLPG